MSGLTVVAVVSLETVVVTTDAVVDGGSGGNVIAADAVGCSSAQHRMPNFLDDTGLHNGANFVLRLPPTTQNPRLHSRCVHTNSSSSLQPVPRAALLSSSVGVHSLAPADAQCSTASVYDDDAVFRH